MVNNSMLVLSIITTIMMASYTAGSTNKEYVIVNITANWHSAFMFCRAQNMTLATISSEAEQQKIQQQILEAGYDLMPSFWIGGTDQNDGGKWHWMINGKPMRSYTNWGPGQPDNYGNKEHCAGLWRNQVPMYSWNDYDCGQLYYPICEYDPMMVCEAACPKLPQLGC